MHIVLGAFTVVFKIWMLVDALSKRGCCNNQWYFIIVLIPFGEWIYFFSVKIHDPNLSAILKKLPVIRKKTPLAQYRYTAEHCPSAANRTLLAKALFDHNQFAEARALAEQLLVNDPNSKEALYVKARCLLQLGEKEPAIVILENLINSALSFRDYEAVHILADTYSGLDRHQDAIALLQRVLKNSTRVPHALALARELSYIERFEEARAVLKESVDAARFAPKFIKKSDRGSTAEAKLLLKRLELACKKPAAS